MEDAVRIEANRVAIGCCVIGIELDQGLRAVFGRVIEPRALAAQGRNGSISIEKLQGAGLQIEAVVTVVQTVAVGNDEEGNLVEQAPHPILSDVRVRQALIMGWDHEDARFLAGEAALPLPGPVTPSLPQYFNSDLEPYPYDLDAAGALLDEAGWVDSDGDGIRDNEGTPLALELLYLNPNEDDATLMADYWRDLGVDTTLTTGEQGAIISDRLVPQNFDMAIIGISWAQPTPDVMLNFLYSSQNDPGTNFTSFVNEEFDTILTDLASGSCDPAERQPLYYRVQEIAHEEAITDYLYTQVAHVAKTPRLTGIEFTTWGTTPINEWVLDN